MELCVLDFQSSGSAEQRVACLAVSHAEIFLRWKHGFEKWLGELHQLSHVT